MIHPRMRWACDAAASLENATAGRIHPDPLVADHRGDPIRKILALKLRDPQLTREELSYVRGVIRGWAEENNCHVRSVREEKGLIVADIYIKHAKGDSAKSPFEEK